MYKLIKSKGFGQVLTIENTDTRATYNLGTISHEITDILNKAELEYPHPADEWNITVNSDVAKELVGLMLTMKKPIRDQRKPKLTEEEIKENNRKIDAMDVMLGLASYTRG